jgi:preprotein translocase subunit SecG
MYQFILLIHVLVACFLILLVLIQQGKGATMGAAFGSGASQTVFGSRGSGSFLLKVTSIFILLFFSTSIALNHMATSALKQPVQAVSPETLPVSNPSTVVLPPAVSPESIPAPSSAQTEKK